MKRAAIALVSALILEACGPPKPVLTPDARAALSPAASLRADLSAIFTAPQFNHAIWSVLVRPVASSENLFALNADKLVMPASTMKIVTAAAVGEKLGWNHRLVTKVVTNAPVESGVLRGDLAVIGGGDPGISERSEEAGALQSLARQVRDAGITRIEGGIIGDDDLFDDKGWGDGWTLDNLPYGYSALFSALSYNDGAVDLVIRAGETPGDPVDIQVRPEGSGLVVDNRLVTVAESGTGALTLQRLPRSSRVTVAGQIPAKAAPFVRTASVDNPTAFFAAAFRRALLEQGIEVIGDAIDIDEFGSKPDFTTARVLATRQSRPMVELIASMMRVSQNQHAEILQRVIGGRPAIQAALTAWGIGNDSVVAADGSGLSRYNYLTSEALVRILQRMHTDPTHATGFPATLSVAGRDAPFLKRFAGTAAEGNVKAKTGTITNVRAIAGYVTSADGDRLAFSIIANNAVAPNAAIDAAADKALIRLAAYSGHAAP